MKYTGFWLLSIWEILANVPTQTMQGQFNHKYKGFDLLNLVQIKGTIIN